jgi:putative hemolysin
MGAIATEAIVILLLILFNGAMAMSEIAIVSARKARLLHRAGQGDSGARAALKLANEPSRFLSTVQIGITLVGILTGAFGGATIAAHLSSALSRFPWLEPYGEAIGLSMVVIAISFASLVLGELVPKRLGLHNPERVASMVAKPMRWLSTLASPAVRVLIFSTESVLRVFGVRPGNDPPVTEEEIKLLIEQGTQAGVFHQAEQELLMNVFRLADRSLNQMMTTRREIVWFDIKDTPEDILPAIAAHPHSRFLICDGSLDKVVGIARAKDLLVASLSKQPFDLKSAIRLPLIVPESTPALRVLEMFKQRGTHLAVVIDEHGGTQGLVTHHDIMEAIVGDIPLPDSPRESPAIRREDGSWLCDGSLDIDEFKRLIGLERLPREEQSGYYTLGGMILAHLGRIPTTGEHFEWGSIYFEILDMDRHRIDKVLVKQKA